MHHETEDSNGFRSYLSIIRLSFAEPFIRDHPPESVHDAWKTVLENIAKDKYWDWMAWGVDLQDQKAICIVITWDRFVLQDDSYGDESIVSNDWRTYCRYALRKMRESGVREKLDVLTPYLAAEPEVHNTVARGSIIWPRKSEVHVADLMSIRTPSSGELHDAAQVEVSDMCDRCRRNAGNVICVRAGQSRFPGDMDKFIFTIDTGEGTHGVEGDCCTFLSLLLWTNEESMVRFKDPTNRSMATPTRRLDQDWWQKNILAPLEVLQARGANVDVRCFRWYPWTGNKVCWPMTVKESDARLEGEDSSEDGEDDKTVMELELTLMDKKQGMLRKSQRLSQCLSCTVM